MTATRARPPRAQRPERDIWRITLDRPEPGNALTPALAAELLAALEARPERARVVLLLANVPVLRRRDIGSFADAADPGVRRRLAHDWHRSSRRLLSCLCPWSPACTPPWPGPGSG